MNLYVLSDNAQIQKLRVAEVVHYLEQDQWIKIEHPNPRLLVFEKGTDDRGKPIQAVLPSKDDYEDRPYLVAKVVNLLAGLKDVPFQDIVSEINADVSGAILE